MAAPVERALALAGPLAALQSLRDELTHLRRATEGLPRVGHRCRRPNRAGTFCL